MKFNWDDLGELGRRVADTISDAADTVGKRTGEVVEVQKIKSQIGALQRENEKDFLDMGKMIVDKYKNGETVDSAFTAICEEVESRLTEIKEAEKTIVEIRGNGFCKECQTPLTKGMAYCPTCGAKVDLDEDDIFEEEDASAQNTVFEEKDTAAEDAVAEGTEAEALNEAVAATVADEAEADQAKPDTEESLADHIDSLEGKEGEV